MDVQVTSHRHPLNLAGTKLSSACDAICPRNLPLSLQEPGSFSQSEASEELFLCIDSLVKSFASTGLGCSTGQILAFPQAGLSKWPRVGCRYD